MTPGVACNFFFFFIIFHFDNSGGSELKFSRSIKLLLKYNSIIKKRSGHLTNFLDDFQKIEKSHKSKVYINLCLMD